MLQKLYMTIQENHSRGSMITFNIKALLQVTEQCAYMLVVSKQLKKYNSHHNYVLDHTDNYILLCSKSKLKLLIRMLVSQEHICFLTSKPTQPNHLTKPDTATIPEPPQNTVL